MNGGARLAAKVQLPVTTMHALLVSRKEALEAEIRERFARARADGAPKPDVRTLSAILRSVKHQLAAVQR
jgi:hypothetical protein